MRRALLGFSFVCGFAVGAVGPVRAETSSSNLADEPRPVILVEHEIQNTSPFASANPQASDGPARLPPVPTTAWQPETRWEPAVRVDRSATTRAAGEWRTLSPTTSTTVAETTLVRPLPIAGSVHASDAALTIPASGPWPPVALPNHPYAIGGVNPRIPAVRPESHYLAKTVWGETKQFVAGQPVRNTWRYLTP